VRQLYDLFWVKQKPAAKSSPRIATIGMYAARVLLIVLPVIFTYWVANYNNRSPTLLDGTWDVVEVSSNLETTAGIPSVIFFERNRAHLCVFKQEDGSYAWHHFELNPEARTITVWQRWLQKGTKIFDGHYEMSGTRLVLNGKLANKDEDSMITLRKRG